MTKSSTQKKKNSKLLIQEGINAGFSDIVIYGSVKKEFPKSRVTLESIMDLRAEISAKPTEKAAVARAKTSAKTAKPLTSAKIAKPLTSAKTVKKPEVKAVRPVIKSAKVTVIKTEGRSVTSSESPPRKISALPVQGAAKPITPRERLTASAQQPAHPAGVVSIVRSSTPPEHSSRALPSLERQSMQQPPQSTGAAIPQSKVMANENTKPEALEKKKKDDFYERYLSDSSLFAVREAPTVVEENFFFAKKHENDRDKTLLSKFLRFLQLD